MLDLLMNMPGERAEHWFVSAYGWRSSLRVAPKAPSYDHTYGRADLRGVLCDSKT
jgi:hypothetical protein